MEEISISFEGNTESFKCKCNDKKNNSVNKFSKEKNSDEKNINYLYKGKKINKELTSNEQLNQEDKNQKSINTIVNKKNDEKNNQILILSKEIICPQCKENILLDIKDFKINLQGCKNGHKINNILLHKYEESQKIDSSKIICQECNNTNKYESHNHEFYICCNCSKNLCPLCKSNHDKTHIVINYEDKNYICKKHNESYIKYCETCKENICIICEKKHNNHNIHYLGKILVSREELEESNENLRIVIDKFKYKVKVMKEVLDKMANILDIYYKINNNIIQNYNIRKRNYILLSNFNFLKDNNEQLIKDLTKAINSDKIYEYSIDHFYNDYGEKYVGEIKNGLKEGKGVLYLNTKNNFEFKRYEGEFKNDVYEGNGSLFLNNGLSFERKFKNGINEGKEIDIPNLNMTDKNVDKNIKNECVEENKCDRCAKIIGYIVIYFFIILFITAIFANNK